MVTTRSVHICEICGEEYSTREKAEACERILTQCPLFEVGQKLRITSGRDKGNIVEIKEWSYASPECVPSRLAHTVQYRVEFTDGDSRTVFENILDYEAA